MGRQEPTKMTVKSLQQVQAESFLNGANNDVKPDPPTKKVKPRAEQEMPVQGLRLHRDMIEAIAKWSKKERRKFSDVTRELIRIGMEAKGITYDD